ncbi:hypothetical protein [Stenotrophomonas sp.]|uniref:hypothetical protein n=1 Tax=Stenotrophomonas sp. TaxID=69392 RepID=UPI0028A7C8A3|nr:hypothetical protein [Stenotrophomonas sp.]
MSPQRHDPARHSLRKLLCTSLLVIAPAADALAAGYVPSAVEAFILETVLADEARTLEQGGQTVLLAPADASAPGATAAAATVRHQFAAFYRGERTSARAIPHMAVVIAMTALRLEQPGQCRTDHRTCAEAIRRAGPTRDDTDGLRTVVARFQAAGLDMSAIESSGARPTD